MKTLIALILLLCFLVPQVSFAGLQFDGSDDYVDAGDPTTYDFGSGNYSFSVWVKPTSVSVYQLVIAKDNNGVGTRQFIFGLGSTVGQVVHGYFTDDVSIPYLDGGTVTAGVWQHVVGQRVGNSFQTYVNGVLVASGTTGGSHGSMQSSTASLNIGRRTFFGANQYFSGQLDDVRIYNRALSASEVLSLYRGDYKTRVGLVGYWPLYGATSGTFEQDLTGYKNHGTRTNGPVRAASSPSVFKFRR